MIDYKIIRSSRKTTCIQINNNGTVVVKTNNYTSEQKINEFVAKKSKLIEKYIAYQNNNNKYKLNDSLNDGSVLFYLGNKYFLVKTNIKNPCFKDNSLFIPINYNKQKLIKWFKNQANLIILERAKLLEKLFKKQSSGFSVFKCKNTFGKCFINNKIKLNCNLLAFEIEIIDYVIIHELAHLKYHNHKKQFWAEVNKMDKNYIIHRKKLKQDFYKTMFLQ